ncbi:MAG: ComF family protein [Rhodospirillaceae bacterium]
MLGSTLRSAARLAGRILDTVLPPRCLACGDTVDRQGGVCPACWRGLSFIAPPLCDRCGLPFGVDILAGAECGACLARPPPFTRARAVLVYDEASRLLVTRLKYGDQTYAAPAYGGWLARAGAELLAEATLMAPVPLHRWRLLRRRYNQAALLGEALRRLSAVPYRPDLLIRHRQTVPQVGLSGEARQRNVRGAFRVRHAHRPLVTGARVLLIDDVLTTGATVGECARLLMREGAARVDVLTLARAVRAE